MSKIYFSKVDLFLLVLIPPVQASEIVSSTSEPASESFQSVLYHVNGNLCDLNTHLVDELNDSSSDSDEFVEELLNPSSSRECLLNNRINQLTSYLPRRQPLRFICHCKTWKMRPTSSFGNNVHGGKQPWWALRFPNSFKSSALCDSSRYLAQFVWGPISVTCRP